MVLTSSSVPDEMIFEILCWLPIKSLLRFKCVCKMWCSIIQDHKFMDKHRHRTSCTMIYRNPHTIHEHLVTSDENFDAGEGEDADFHLVAYQEGVLLERNRITGTHRLRNPAIRKMLDLPHITKYVGMCYIPATNDLKLVGLRSDYGGLLAYSVVTVDTNITWKRLYSPSMSRFAYFWPATKVIGTIFYCIRQGVDGDHEIDCLDLEIDIIINTVKIPHDFFLDWSDVYLVVWNSKLSLASIEQEQLHVWVLENYSKHKWADRKIIIPLTFLKFIGNMSSEDIMPCMMIGNKLWSWFSRDQCYRTFFSFDIESQKVRFIRSRTRMKIPSLYRPSLCSFKGMRPYDGLPVFHIQSSVPELATCKNQRSSSQQLTRPVLKGFSFSSLKDGLIDNRRRAVYRQSQFEMSNYSNPPPPSSSVEAAAASYAYGPHKVQIRPYQGKFNRIYRPYKAKSEKNRQERKSQVPQVQESKLKEKLPEKMLGIEEYEGDLIDLVDLDFEHVEEEDDFIAHSIGEFMTDFEKSFEKGWYRRQFNRRR